ncbi:MAG: hypothetical protein IKL57_02010 [Oscillospiraceae bacterium]|nr:hypothetical protein [Oscillospiraceae bacterium]
MKKIFMVLMVLFAALCVLTACSNDEQVIEKNDVFFENEENPGESCTLPEDALSTEEQNELEVTEEPKGEKPSLEDFEHVVLFDGDSSPIIAMTEEERAEFLEIIGAYDIEKTEEIDPAIGTMDRSIIFKSEEKGGALYVKELGGKGLLSMKWNRQTESEAFDVSGDIYYDLEDLRNKIQKSARDDGRWPFLFPDEEEFLRSLNPPEFDEEHFRAEFDTFIHCVTGDYDSESNRIGPEKALHYCLWKVLRDHNAKGEALSSNDYGQALAPEEEADRIAEYVFGIAELSHYEPSEEGFYAVPFGARIINYKITDIRTDGSYVFCEVFFTDPDDTDFEWEPLAKKNYCFIRFEAEGEVFYRAVSSSCEFGEEYGF